jgi:hypothetical protein
MSAYFTSIDVDKLFKDGVVSFRMDPGRSVIMTDVAKSSDWHMPEGIPSSLLPEHCHDDPIAKISAANEARLKTAIQGIINDEVLFEPLLQYGKLSVNEVEMFNGAIDTSWHHDGLAGKRGHAGDFFLLCYTHRDEAHIWQPEWGGSFDYGERRLGEDWVHSIEAIEDYASILPTARTCVFGWNGNPRLIHRSAPLSELRDRIVIAASIKRTPWL